MKIKGLALIVAAVSLLAGASLSSCKKVDPTALNVENMQYKTTVKGVVRATLKPTSTGSETKVTLAKVTVIAKVYVKGTDKNGNPTSTFVTSVSANTNNSGEYKMDLPIASGSTYNVNLSSTSEQITYSGSSAKTVVVEGTASITDLSAGQESVKHILCSTKGYVDDPEK